MLTDDLCDEGTYPRFLVFEVFLAVFHDEFAEWDNFQFIDVIPDCFCCGCDCSGSGSWSCAALDGGYAGSIHVHIGGEGCIPFLLIESNHVLEIGCSEVEANCQWFPSRILVVVLILLVISTSRTDGKELFGVFEVGRV